MSWSEYDDGFVDGRASLKEEVEQLTQENEALKEYIKANIRVKDNERTS